MADLGRAALVVSLGLSVYALVAGVGRRRHEPPPARGLRAQRALLRVRLDADRGDRARDRARAARLLVRVRRRAHEPHAARRRTRSSAFWGGQEGSLLLWLLVLTGYGALAVALNRTLLRDLIAWVVPVLGGIATFFAFVLVAVASPFDTQTAPVDGAGLTPSLQNPYMVAHPPMLYLGYVGLSIPFAFAAGAMLSGRTDERWIVATRRWTLAAWMFLGFGQLLGCALGVRRGGLGRLLRVGPRRERGADAVARRDRVPALRDDPGAQGDAEGLEHGARRARVRALGLRHVPHALRRRQLDPLVREEPDRRAGSSRSSSSRRCSRSR